MGYDYIFIRNPNNSHVGAVVCQLPGINTNIFDNNRLNFIKDLYLKIVLKWELQLT